MSKVELTVAIITYNEENDLEKALESVSFAAEIVVVDSFSSDTTVNIARQFTDKIYTRKFDNFSSQRNFSIEHASYEWVLVIDADETIPAALQDEITNVVNTSPRAECAYSIGRSNIFMGRHLKHGGLNKDRVTRLFPRSVRYRSRVHETPDTGSMPVINLKNKMNHNTYKGYAAMLTKTDKYSTLKARDMYESGYNPTLFKMLFKPAFRFFRHYILRGGLRDGKPGFVFASISGLEVFQRLTKVWRMQAGEEI